MCINQIVIHKMVRITAAILLYLVSPLSNARGGSCHSDGCEVIGLGIFGILVIMALISVGGSMKSKGIIKGFFGHGLIQFLLMYGGSLGSALFMFSIFIDHSKNLAFGAAIGVILTFVIFLKFLGSRHSKIA